MPQLNPTPWLLMMLMTWLAINVMLTLINNINLMNNLTTTKHHAKQETTWAWPW